MVTVLAIVFWGSLVIVLYSYLAYPLLLSVLSRLFGRRVQVGPLPRLSVAFLVPVFNEEKVIVRKIENILALEYPPELLEIWVGSDCSNDATHELVCGLNNPRVKLWVAPERGGKTQVINRMALEIRADILVMTDANTMHGTESLKRLIAPFADANVGGVAGHIDHLISGTKELEERVYRSFESRQKTHESNLHSTISAFGGFYAVRASLFRPIAPNAYSNDDVLIPMDIIRQGKRMIFEPRACSSEDMSERFAVEFARRIRIGAGNYQAFFWLLDFLNPLKGWPFFCYISHKVTRWFSPFFLALGLISCTILAVVQDAPDLYRTIWYWGLAISVFCWISFIVRFKPGTVLFYFLAMNAGLGLGVIRFARGIRTAAWNRTDRNV